MCYPRPQTACWNRRWTLDSNSRALFFRSEGCGKGFASSPELTSRKLHPKGGRATGLYRKLTPSSWDPRVPIAQGCAGRMWEPGPLPPEPSGTSCWTKTRPPRGPSGGQAPVPRARPPQAGGARAWSRGPCPSGVPAVVTLNPAPTPRGARLPM